MLCRAQTLTPFRLTFQVGLVVEFYPHRPEVGGLNPRICGEIFKISSASCNFAKKNQLGKMPIPSVFAE